MKKEKILFLIIILLVTIFSTLVVFQLWKEKERELSEKALLSASVLVSNIDEGTLKGLQPKREDESSEGHLLVKDALSNFLRLNRDARFAYLYVKRDNDLYFLVDAEPVNSEDYSYPGQLYDEAGEEYYLPFIDKEVRLVGPVSDRWGTWVSALVPVVDSRTGDVVAVLGVDFDADAWRLMLISEMSFVIAFFVVAFVGLWTLFFLVYGGSKSTINSVRWRVLPVIIILLISIAGVVGFILWEQEKNHQESINEDILDSTQRMYGALLEQQKKDMLVITSLVGEDKKTIDLLKERDGEGLLEAWRDVFERDFKKNNITHLYFFDKERVCFLRVHNPNKSGDVINRGTALYAEKTGEISSGIEVGPLGLLTMRIVKPVFVEEELVGYVEVGKEVEDALMKLHRRSFKEIILVLNKNYLERERWEEGMDMMERGYDWDLLEKEVIAYSSTDIFNENIFPLLRKKEEKVGIGSFFAGDSWVFSSFPLNDFSQREVGRIIIAINNYTEQQRVYGLIRVIVVFGTVIFLCLIMVIYVILRRTDRDILWQEKEIRKAIRRYDELIKQSKTFVWEIDKSGKYTYVSENVKEILGYSAKEIIGKKTVFDLHPKKGLSDFQENVLGVIERREKIQGLDNPIEHKNGDIVWVTTSGFPILNNKGKLLNYKGSDTDITEKKTAENKIKESEERLRQVTENMSEVFWLRSEDNSKILYISPSYEKVWGRTTESLYENPNSFIDSVHKDDLEMVLKEFEKEKSGGGIFDLEYRIVRPDNEIRWIWARTFPVEDEKGDVIRYTGVGIDITEKKRAEDLLKKREEQFELAVEGSNDGIWDWDLLLGSLYLSPRWKAQLGYEDEELENSFATFERLLHQDDRERVLTKAKDYIEGRVGKYEEEFRMMHKDGTHRWILAKGAAVRDEKGKPYRIAGSHSDVTERKNFEIDLMKEKKELEKFKLAVQNASDHIVITDENGICLYMNNAAERITGFKVEEMIGKKVGTKDNWGGLLKTDDYKKLWKTIKEDKKVFLGEIKNKRKFGEVYDAMASISPILSEDGEVVFFVGIERDITEERRVDQAKTEFVSLASHQLRTPLTAINWYTEMLLAEDAGEINEEQRKYLKEVYTGNQRMVELVNALLNVSRLELGTFVIENEDVDLVTIASSVISELRPQVEGKNQLLEEFYSPGMPKIKGDPKLLNIIFQNLLSNAVKYTPEKGKVKLEILLTKKGDAFGGKEIEQEGVLIIVADNGYGIPLVQQGKIFTKLFRADNVLERDTEGTGLGLYIIKAIVDHSQGSVWFESEEGRGTTFYVFFPKEGMREKKGTKPLD